MSLELVRLVEDLRRRLERLETAGTGYQTGSFTPAYVGSTASGTYTYDVQIGYYTRIGARVFYDITLDAATRPVAPTGDAQINGLPFVASSDANSTSSVVLSTIDGVTITAATMQLVAFVIPGSATLQFFQISETGVASVLPAANLGAGAIMRLSGNYRV